MPRWSKITLITVAVIFGLLLLSMLVVPWQIKKQGSAWIAENTDRSLTIDKAFFNPFALTVELSGVKLTEQNSQRPFVSFKRLMLSGSLNSLLQQAIILDRVELDDPFVNIELLGKQEFNFSDFTQLGGNQSESEAAEPRKPLHFSLNNIILSGGQIDFTDQTSDKKSQHKVRQLSFSVPFIGNIPYLTDDYINPQLFMLLNGSEVRAQGQLKPFHDSLETHLSFSFYGIDLPFYAYHSPLPLPIVVKEGSLDFEVDLAYRVSRSDEPRLMIGGEMALSDIDLRELDGRELLRMPTLILDLDWADLFKMDFNLISLDIYEPQVTINRDSAGLLNFQRVMQLDKPKAGAEQEPSEENASAGGLPLLVIENLNLIDGQILFRDDYVTNGFSEEIKAITLELKGLSTHQKQKTAAALKLRTERDLTLAISGNLGINPPTATMDLAANGLLLKPLFPYLAPFLTAPLEGTLDLGGQVNYTEEGNIQLQQVQLNLKNLLVPFFQQDQFQLSTLSISDCSFDLQQQSINLGAIQFQGGEVKVSRLADGTVSPLQLLKDKPDKKEPTDEQPVEASLPWNIYAKSIDLQKFRLFFSDMVPTKKPQVNIPDFNFHAENLSYPLAQKSPFKLNAKIGKKGSINVAGTAVHTPLKLEAQTQITDFPLADFNTFIPDNIKVSLKDGKFFSKIDVTLEQRADKFTGQFSGKTNISNFNLRDPLGDGELLAWESLNLDGIQGGIGPFALQVKEVALSNYQANIQITKDGRINLTSVTADGEQAEDGGNESGPDKVEEVIVKETSAEPPPDIRIDALTLQGGTVSFIDRSMANIFSATMYELGGRVTGMASDELMLADVDLRGQLENHSPLTISGKINPLSKDLFADLTISFKDIDLTPMTPYSGTYLGYVIDKGKLYLDLSYHIEKRKITADNKVMIDQFTLGDSVESDKATSLPIGLAIALLKDSNDEIHLDVPVYGDLDDPDFSVAGVIFTVIKNLLVKAATSPFSLLSAMMGAGDEDFTSITFASGLAVIDQEQLTKLQGLAEMLAQRPSLILEISAYADENNDAESYRQEQLRLMLVEARWQELQENGAAPESKAEIVISTEDYPELILSVYKAAEFPRP
ncbi:MAG: DUF748 domain-containing protein, partial [Deltaproteobacteria bacterium]|nr:DUF748 domain-containing protein [Deltaproteobacteria bacterium]